MVVLLLSDLIVRVSGPAFFFFKQKTAFEVRISDWSSDVCSSDLIDDIAYMKAMIPHHSMAILTSERAQIRDPEVRLLADRIIDSQVREIHEMKRLIAELKVHPVPEDAPVLPSYRDRGVAPPPPATDAPVTVHTPPPPE